MFDKSSNSSKPLRYQAFLDYKKHMSSDDLGLRVRASLENKTSKDAYSLVNRDHFLEALLEECNQLSDIIEDYKRSGKEDECISEIREQYHHYTKILLRNATSYQQPADIAKYKETLIQLGDKPPERTWNQKIMEEFSIFASAPIYMSTLMRMLSLSNIYRLGVVLNRMLWRQLLALASQLELLDKQNNIHGHPINVDILDTPTNALNFLSVSIFASKFLIDSLLIIKHTFLPTKDEKALWAYERCIIEIDNRHERMVNDTVWTWVNLFSNYAPLFRIPMRTAGWLTVGFLAFDFLWLIYSLYRAEARFAHKEAEYLAELKHAKSPAQKLKIEMKLEKLKLRRTEVRYRIGFCMVAAALLVGIFIVALSVGSPLIAALACFGGAIAVAMYASSGHFGKYVRYLKEDSKDPAKILAKQQELSKFFMSMLKNTLMPLIIIGLFMINAPGAIALLALYIGYECGGSAYFKEYPWMPFLIMGVCAINWQAAVALTVIFMMVQMTQKRPEKLVIGSLSVDRNVESPLEEATLATTLSPDGKAELDGGYGLVAL